MPVSSDLPGGKEILETLQRVFPFREFCQQQPEWFLNRLLPISFQADQEIYKAGSPAQYVYIIYSGKIEYSADENAPSRKSVLSAGQIIGLEAIESGSRYSVSTYSRGNCVLLRLHKQDLAAFIHLYPGAVADFNVLIESRQLASKLNPRWLDSGEEIAYISRRNSVLLMARLILPIVLFFSVIPLFFLLTEVFALSFILSLAICGLACLLFFAWIGWNILDWRNDFHAMTSRRIVSLERVAMLYDSRAEVPLDAVLSFAVETGQWGRWFSYGNIIVKSYTGSVTLKQVKDYEAVIRLMDCFWKQRQFHQEQNSRQEMDTFIRQRMGLTDQVQTASAGKSDDYLASQEFTPGKFQKWLADLFRMRFQDGQTVTYRTHWLILFKMLVIPTLLMVLVIAALIVTLIGNFLFLEPVTQVMSLCAALLVCWMIWLYQYADWYNDVYIVTDDEIIDVEKKPLGLEQKKTASLKNIISIEYKRIGILGMLFNFGTVIIKVGESDFTFDYVYNPSEVQRELFYRINTRKTEERRAEIIAERERIATFLDSYQQVMQEQKPQSKEPY